MAWTRRRLEVWGAKRVSGGGLVWGAETAGACWVLVVLVVREIRERVGVRTSVLHARDPN